MMVLTRCDTTFHERIAGKYRLGRRVRGRWPSLFFRGRGTGDSYGKIWSTILIRLEFHHPKRKNSAATFGNRSGVRIAPFLVRNSPFGESTGLQVVRSSSRVFDHLYSRIPERLVPERSGSGKRAEWQVLTGGDPPRNAPMRGHTGSAVSGHCPTTQRPTLPAMMVSREGAPGKWRVLSIPAPGEAVPRKTGILPGNQPSMAAGEGPRQEALRQPPMVVKLTTHLPPLIRQLRKRVAALTTQATPLVHRAYARRAGPGSMAGNPALSGTPLQGTLESRRTVPASGIFRKQGERVPVGDEFVFNQHGKIEREVAELKETVVQTRKLVEEQVSSPSLPIGAEIRKQIDVELISEQVYRAIERRIRQERERRGV